MTANQLHPPHSAKQGTTEARSLKEALTISGDSPPNRGLNMAHFLLNYYWIPCLIAGVAGWLVGNLIPTALDTDR
jgi:hypothetical protein